MDYKAQFDIHGLPLAFRSDHPVLFRAVADDLQAFRVKRARRAGMFRLTLETFSRPHVEVLFRTFGRHPEDTWRKNYPDRQVSVHQRVRLLVNLDLSKRLIQAGADPDPALFPDPAYHRWFSRPVGFLLKQRGLFFLHAGCVAENGRGVLIAGHSHAGKSTLALSAVRAGFKFLSDEQPLLSMKGGLVQALAFPRRIRLDRPSARRFPELLPLLRVPGPERILFHIGKIRPRSVAASCLPRLLVFPQFRKRGRLRVLPLDSSAALAKLLQDDHFVWYRDRRWEKLSRAHLAVLERLVRQTAAFRVLYRDRDVPRIPGVFRGLLRG